jgi:hypothetical protein
MKIAYRIVFMLPDNVYSRAINEVRVNNYIILRKLRDEIIYFVY